MKLEGTHIVVDTTEGGREIFKTVGVIKTPLIKVRNAKGEEFTLMAGNYKEASEQEREAFENGDGKPACLDNGKRFDFN